MSMIIEELIKAQQFALANKPQIGGFPFLAKVLQQAGITKNTWALPSCQSIYFIKGKAVVQQGTPLITGTHEIKNFNQEDLIKIIQLDQNGKSSFAEFLQSAWEAGVTIYEVDFIKRYVTYYGFNNESYRESYPEIKI